MVSYKNDGGQYTDERGTSLPLHVVKTLAANADGSPVNNGRQAAAASRPVALSAEDKAALDAAKGYYSTASLYVDNTVRAAGIGIMCLVTTSGTATFTIGGVNVVFTLTAGNPLILPLAVTKTVLGTAIATFYAMG